METNQTIELDEESAQLKELVSNLSEERKTILFDYIKNQDAFSNHRTNSDMHIHTTNSDGKLFVSEVLILAKMLELNNISITDHDCVDAYFDDDLITIAQKLKIKIITGCEFVCMGPNSVPIEILGYGINLNLARLYLNKYGITQKYLEFYRFEKIPKIFKNLGITLEFDMGKIDFSAKDPGALPVLFDSILNNKQAKTLCEEENPELTKSVGNFLRLGLNNPSSKFFMDMTSTYPSYTRIIELIHNLGGIAFLAHPHQYKAEMQNVLNAVAKANIDGIECFHFTSTISNPNGYKELLEFAKKHKLMISGGSDFHSPNAKSEKGQIGNVMFEEKNFLDIDKKIKLIEKLNHKSSRKL